MSDSYGKVAFLEDLKAWVIVTQPHVALRMKRIFPKIYPGQQGWLRLSDTPENARELEWFLERFPHQMNGDRDRLARRAQEHREKESLVARMLAGTYHGADFPMALPPRDYQATAAQLWIANKGLLLADEMGTGKTVAGIAGICDPRLRPALVTCMAHLPKQWLRFFRRFAPHLNVHLLRKSTPYDMTGRFHVLRKDNCTLMQIRGEGTPDVIISSYHKLGGWAETLSQLVKSVVWDECQELRRQDGKGGELSRKYAAAQCIADAVEWRMGLSGTPIYNYGVEMFHVLRCIAPDALGTKDEFKTEWCQFSDQVKDPRAFGSYLTSQGVMLRRTRKDIGRELPKCSSIIEAIDCDTDTFESESASCEALARTLLSGTEEWKGQRMHAAGLFDMKLRQATGIAKAPYVAAFVEMLLETEEKVVVYAWHRAVYDELLKRLERFRPVMYTGSESPAKKEYSKQQFLRRDPEAPRVKLLSLRSGAGLDGLQEVCSTVVFAELDWSPGVHEQCTMRVDRDGQTKPVFAYYLLSEEGSDPIVADVCGLKRQQLEGIRDPNAAFIEKLTVDPDHVKKLAAAFLKGRKAKLPEASVA